MGIGAVQTFTAATVIARKDGFLAAEIDKEIVALSIENGTCYGLNRTGSRVWQLLERPIRVEDICATLLGEFNVDPHICETDVFGLLEELRAEDMIAAVE
jgi:hypothetical protein